MRQALAPLLYAEEDFESARALRDPVAKAKPTAQSSRKKTTRESTDGLPLRRWDGLLATLSTMVRNTCRIDEGKTPVHFTRDTEPNAFQARVFALLKAEATFWPNLVPSSRNAKTKTEVTSSC